MSNFEKTAEYISKSKYVVLSTIQDGDTPVVRTLGSFASDGLTVYFSTGKATAKVGQIQANPNVTLLFQHEGQEIPAFKNVSITGTAKAIRCEKELGDAVKLLSERNPRFRERAEKGLLSDTLIFKVEPRTYKTVDLSKGPGAAEEVKLP